MWTLQKKIKRSFSFNQRSVSETLASASVSDKKKSLFGNRRTQNGGASIDTDLPGASHPTVVLTKTGTLPTQGRQPTSSPRKVKSLSASSSSSSQELVQEHDQELETSPSSHVTSSSFIVLNNQRYLRQQFAAFQNAAIAQNLQAQYQQQHHQFRELHLQQSHQHTATMVSRRRILSRSRDDLNLPDAPIEEEDIWYTKDKLLKDHLQEVLLKWEQIDDEIWAKVIVFERNRRVAKAYARAPVLTVNGSDDGFDGFRIGLNGFDNPMRDSKTEDILRHIGHGIKIKMDDEGNILVKRVSKNSVYVKATAEENAISNDVNKLFNGALEIDKPLKLFDMKKFASNVSRELRRAYPDRRKLEIECITAVSFVKQEAELLNCPCWIMIVNLVAMDMLKAKIPPVKSSPRNDIPMAPILGGHHGSSGGSSTNSNSSGDGRNGHHGKNSGGDIRNRPKIPIPTNSDDDPYTSVVGGNSKSKDKPPKLPPRDLNIPKPDYDHDSLMEDSEPRIKAFFNASRANAKAAAAAAKGKDRKYDDPYYCGLRARIPAFVQKALPPRNNKQKSLKSGAPPEELEERERAVARNGGENGIYHHQNIYGQYAGYPPPVVGGARYGKHHNGNGHGPHHPASAMMWHAKSVDSGMASIHSNPYADPLSIRKMNGQPAPMIGKSGDKYSWSLNNNFESESDLSESIYAPIYGRLPLPMRNPNTYAPTTTTTTSRAVAFVGEWE